MREKSASICRGCGSRWVYERMKPAKEVDWKGCMKEYHLKKKKYEKARRTDGICKDSHPKRVH
ncbi:MAG: hypothetical protein PHI48_12050 [Bacteroidales bacterium]|nr:hypothetical protein [Bacteroidales bacterium]